MNGGQVRVSPARQRVALQEAVVDAARAWLEARREIKAGGPFGPTIDGLTHANDRLERAVENLDR